MPLFTGGRVFTQFVLDEDYKTEKIQISNVKFAAGSRNKFHTHTKAQVLVITEGKGIVASKKKEYTVKPGMVVYIPVGEEHWHGATNDSSFAHLSILGGPQELKIVEK